MLRSQNNNSNPHLYAIMNTDKTTVTITSTAAARASKPLIYLVDDEQDIRNLVSLELSKYDLEVEAFDSGTALQQALEQRLPVLCLIDLGLPDMDGMSLIQSLQHKNVGLIIISGRDSLPDKVLGLEFGADDYISKPFDPRELVARVKSVIRRLGATHQQLTSQLTSAQANNSEQSDAPKKQSFAHWTFEPATLTLIHNQSEPAKREMLSAAEADILKIFLAKPQQILARERLIPEHLDPFDRSIDVRISRLRKKLELDHKDPKIIKTVYGAGYMFTPAVTLES